MKNDELDIERALEGSDADMRAFVAALRAAPQATTRPDFTADVLAAARAEEAARRRPMRWLRWAERLTAAVPLVAGFALLLAVGTAVLRPAAPAWSMARLVSYQLPDGTFTASSAAPYVQAFAVTVLAKDPSAAPQAFDSAVEALVRAQTAEGGWANATLSARNVAALGQAAAAGSARALAAYHRGARYLRAHGIGEISLAELVREARAISAQLKGSTDAGLACCIVECAR